MPHKLGKMKEVKEDMPFEFMAEHTVKSGETLSGIAAKYYGSGTHENWLRIYQANKGVIGDNPDIIKPGQVLKIPEKSEKEEKEE
jgi:nucleoid-associated protein YgaU